MTNLSSIPDIPETSLCDGSQLEDLVKIESYSRQLEGLVMPPELGSIDDTQLNQLLGLLSLHNAIIENDNSVKEYDKRLEAVSMELENLQTELTQHGVKTVRCPNCGQIFNPEEGHNHI